MSVIIFGAVVEMKQMSVNDKLDRKKYMGVWRLESIMTARMMIRFPTTVTRYMNRNSTKRMGCRSGSSEIPRRWNSETCVRLSSPTLLAHLEKWKVRTKIVI
jgi:hypothetical protein